MSQEHASDLLPAYALGGLADSERAQVERHLLHCEVCRGELRAYQLAAASLAEAVPPVRPPARLRASLLERVEPQRTSPLEKFSAWLRAAAPAMALAALLLVAGLGALNLNLRQQLRQATAAQAEFRTVMLVGTEAAPDATGLLVTGDDGRAGTLIVDHLPLLPETQQYQLWLVEGEQRTSGGVFSVDEEGYGTLLIEAERPLASYPAFGITIEPAGGSPGPTGPRVLGGQF